MYTLALRGTVPVNPVAELNDVAAVRVSTDFGTVTVPASPGVTFDVTVEVPVSGVVVVRHAFVDEVGNVSPEFSQDVTVPDVRAPLAPTEPLELVSAVWVAS